MKVSVAKNEKDNLIIGLDNQTVAELLRVYLNKDEGVQLAAWKAEHQGSPIILEIKTKGKTAKKAFDEAISAIEKNTGKYLEEFKKAMK